MDVDEVWEQLRIPKGRVGGKLLWQALVASSCGKLLWQALRPVLSSGVERRACVWGLAQI